MSSPAPPRRRGRPAGLAGRELLAVAREVFLEAGYPGTTMDEVARRARISKASLYREHPSKERLYAAVVRDWADAGRDAMRPHLEALVAEPDVRAGLVALARVMHAGILSPDVLRMRRLVTSEATNHPEVAADYLTRSWERNVDGLAAALRTLDADGRLRVADPGVSADQLTWLVVGAPLNRRLLTGADEPGVTDDAVEAAVDLFLAGHRPVDA